VRVALYVHCFFPDHYHGTEAYTLSVAKGLISRGHEPIVVTAVFYGETPQGRLIERRVWEDIQVISIDKNTIPVRTVRGSYDHPEMARIHRDILSELKPDIVHVCHLINHTASLLDQLKELNIPTVATLTDFFGICLTNKLEDADGALCAGPNASRVNCISCFLKSADTRNSPWYARYASKSITRPVVARALAMASNFGQNSILGARPLDITQRPERLSEAMKIYRYAIAPTNYLRACYRANGFGFPIKVSRFGVDIPRRQKSRSSEKNIIRFGFIGQIAPHKGVHLIVRALAKANRSNVSLQIYGDLGQSPPYASMLLSEAEGFQIKFLGTFNLGQLADRLLDIDILIIPSTWYENSPLILLQALATGTPVIVSDVPGLTEFVVDGTNGLVVKRDDVHSLMTALCKIADSKSLLDQLTEGARWDRTTDDMIDDVIDIYHKVLANGRLAS